jgi:hypothetical protein
METTLFTPDQDYRSATTFILGLLCKFALSGHGDSISGHLPSFWTVSILSPWIMATFTTLEPHKIRTRLDMAHDGFLDMKHLCTPMHSVYGLPLEQLSSCLQFAVLGMLRRVFVGPGGHLGMEGLGLLS